MCITRVSQGRVGAGRTVGLWEGSVCLVHPGVPTASAGEPQTRLHTQGDTLRLHSPLQPGVWGVYHHKPQKQPQALCPGSTARFTPSGPPRASPAIQHLLQGHGTHLWTDTHGRCSLMASTWPCFRLAWGPRPVAWADSVLERLLLSGISSSSSSSFFCQRLLQVHAAHLPFSIGEAPPQQTHVAETLALG